MQMKYKLTWNELVSTRWATCESHSDKTLLTFGQQSQKFNHIFAWAHNSSSLIRTWYTHLHLLGLTAVKADAGLTDPLFKANMANIHALTQHLTIERYNTLYYSDQPVCA